jgi:hypothetical protein
MPRRLDWSRRRKGSMENHPVSQEPSQGEIDKSLLDLIHSVRILAENMDVMHRDLRQELAERLEAQDRELDRLKEFAQKNAQVVQILPITTADRLERLIDKKVDGVLEDVRLSVSELKTKLTNYIQTKDAQGAIPQAAVGEDISDVTSRFEVKKDRIHIHFKTDGIEKFWKISRWIVLAIATGGGGWAIIKTIFHIP